MARRRSSAVPALALALGLAAAGLPAPGSAQHSHEAAEPAAAAPGKPKARLYDDLGTYHRAITTASPEAQRYFDQGLRLLYAFNVEEARRSFQQAEELDPSCAMCFWGEGMTLGPHINLPRMPGRTRVAHRATQQALTLSEGEGKATPAERALIAALSKRYSDPPPAEPAAQKAFDEAYASAMREVASRHPDDLDAVALYVEALMNLRPWDLWTIDGKPGPDTEEILAALEKVLAKNPQHPGANHYYIHAIEASPHPEKALAAADRIAALIPGAAHIVHMPSHIYARTGRWADSSESNRQAIAVDKRYLATAEPLAVYPMYVMHNFQFLWFSALMEGRGAEALETARAIVAKVSPEMFEQMQGSDFILEYPIWTLVRLGRWQEALAEPAPPAGLPYAAAVRHAARGIALVRLGRLDEAQAERDRLTAAAASVTAESKVGLNSSRTLLTVADGLLAGKIAEAQGQTEEALRHLQEAVRAEDALLYNEPPDWYLPARHELGATLAASGRHAEAQKVWEEDLRRNPENGWALAGLAESLRRQKKEAEAVAVEARLAKAWERADLKPKPNPS